jgi:hypothetical protein
MPQDPHIDLGTDLDAVQMLIHGFQASRLLRAAADLGLADRVDAQRGAEISAIAADLGVDAGRLKRFFRALSAFGIYAVDEPDRVRHTARSALFRTDDARSVHHMARFWPVGGNWTTWSAFDRGLQAGQTASEIALGTSRFEYLKAHPEEGEIFDLAMGHKPDHPHAAVAEAYDFSDAELIVDVGGGIGMLLRHILSRFDGPDGITFDQHQVVERARDLPENAALGTRHRFEGGSFLEAVPAGGDIYMLADILGCFSDDVSATVLKNIRAAVPDGGRLLVIDRVPAADPPAGNPIDFLTDMHFMLVFPDGRLRSAEELRALLAAAGFGAMRVLPTASAVSIIEVTAE